MTVHDIAAVVVMKMVGETQVVDQEEVPNHRWLLVAYAVAG